MPKVHFKKFNQGNEVKCKRNTSILEYSKVNFPAEFNISHVIFRHATCSDFFLLLRRRFSAVCVSIGEE